MSKTPTQLFSLIEEIHDNAIKKGFWNDKNIPTKICLIHSEVSEAMEAHRRNKNSDIRAFKLRVDAVMNSMQYGEEETEYKRLYEAYIKDSFGSEIAGTIIRCLDLCAYLNIDIEAHILAEHRYNLTRPYMHGDNKNY